MHIAIAGNIGAGKTTLTKLLSKHYRWQAHYEEVLENPYLDDFYHEMERWSFNLQIYFLYNRFSQILDIQKSGKKIIQKANIIIDSLPNTKNRSLKFIVKRLTPQLAINPTETRRNIAKHMIENGEYTW